MRNWTILLLGTGALAVVGCEQAANEYTDTPIWAQGPVIEAQGRAIVEFIPNRISFSVTYEHRASRSEDASAVAALKANIATEAIREIAGEDAVVTTNLNVSPYYEQITLRGPDESERIQENRHPDALIGYVARAMVSVEMTEPERMAEVRGAAMAVGPVSTGNVTFRLEPSAAQYREAFAAAVEDAAARAHIVAEASGSRLEGIVVLREQSHPCLGSPSTTPPGRANADSIVVTGSRVQRDEFSSNAPLQVVDAGTVAEAGLFDTEAAVQSVIEHAGNYALAADISPQTITANVCAIFAIED